MVSEAKRIYFFVNHPKSPTTTQSVYQEMQANESENSKSTKLFFFNFYHYFKKYLKTMKLKSLIWVKLLCNSIRQVFTYILER